MKTTYTGSCHCGNIRFEVDADIDHVRVCDCSICAKRGALNFRVDEPDFRLRTPLSDLSVYVWGSGTGRDYFCPVCGILPFRRPRHPTAEEIRDGIKPSERWAINVRCLDGIDATALPRRRIFGRSL